MSKLILGVNNRIDEALVTLGSTGATWDANLPLANIKSYILSDVARNTTVTDFSITVDLSSAPYRPLGIVSVAGHNLSSTSTITVELFDGATSVFGPVVYNIWPYLSEDNSKWNLETYAVELVDDLRISTMMPTFIWCGNSNIKANKVVLSFSDPAPTESYIDIGRIFVGESINPSSGVAYGDLSYGYIDKTEINQNKQGVKFNRKYRRLRNLQASFKLLKEGEAFEGLFEVQRINGLFGEVVVINDIPVIANVGLNSAVSSTWFSKSFLGNFSSLDMLTHPNYQRNGVNINIEEVAL